MKDPAFLFYPESFLVGTMDMTDEEVGQYIRLLCRQHQKGHLPASKIETLSDELQSKFIKDDDGKYYNRRLDDEIQKRKKFVDSKKVNGAKGGRPKKTDSKPIGKPTENLQETDRFSVAKPTENLPINRNRNRNTNKDIDIDISYISDIERKPEVQERLEAMRAKIKEANK